MAADAGLEINLFGPLQVRSGGVPLELPPSKKARALLALLVLTGRSHSRARLVERFWDVSDDPRAGLRWCLSRLRGALGEHDALVANRTTLAFRREGVWVDALALRQAQSELGTLALDDLERLAARCQGELLEGLDFPELHAAQAFCTHERLQAQQHRQALLRALVGRLADEPNRAVPHARLLVHADPSDPEARAALVGALRAAGLQQEAREQHALALQELPAANTASVDEALRGTAGRAQATPRGHRVTPTTTAPVPDSSSEIPPSLGHVERLRDPPLVGRRLELSLLDQMLRDARAGRGGACVVTGEAGVGKSRLLRELLGRAAEHGMVVLVGRCESEDGTPPYLPFVDALDAFFSQLSETLLPSAARAQLATLLPSLTTAHTPAPDDASASPYRYSAFRTVVSTLARSAEGRGVMLAIEDLHWADAESLIMLEFICRELAQLPVLVIATHRDDEDGSSPGLSSTLAAMGRHRGHRRVDLPRLDADNARQLLAQLASLPPKVADLVALRTEGHPLFIEEMIKHLLEEGLLDDDQQPNSLLDTERLHALGLPRGIRDVIELRLSRLSDGCRGMLSVAAALVGPIRWPLLAALVDAEEETLLDHLDEALAARVLRERAAEQEGSYDFTHALIRDALHERLSRPRRTRMHRRIGMAIEEVYGTNLEPHLTVLAHHYREGLGSGPAEKLIKMTLRAGERAISHLGYEGAAELCERSLRALQERSEPAADEDLSRLHALAGEALAKLSRWPEARAHLQQALSRAPSEPTLQASLLLRRAMTESWPLDGDALRVTAEQAQELAQCSGDASLIAAATGYQAQCAQALGDVVKGRGLYQRAWQQAPSSEHPLVAQSLLHYPINMHWSAHFDEAIEIGQTLMQAARKHADGSLLLCVMPVVALAQSSKGRYREGLQALAEAEQFGRDHDIGRLLARTWAMGAGALMDLNAFDAARERAELAHDKARSFRFLPPAMSARIDLVSLQIAGGELGVAADQLPGMKQEVAKDGQWHEWVWALRIAVLEAQLDNAAGRYEAGLERSGLALEMARHCSRPKYEVAALLERSRALLGSGDKRAAVAAAAAAVKRARQLGYPALFVRAASRLLELEGSDALRDEALGLIAGVKGELQGTPHFDAFVQGPEVSQILALQ